MRPARTFPAVVFRLVRGGERVEWQQRVQGGAQLEPARAAPGLKVRESIAFSKTVLALWTWSLCSRLDGMRYIRTRRGSLSMAADSAFTSHHKIMNQRMCGCRWCMRTMTLHAL
jgi:hypothetical protein